MSLRPIILKVGGSVITHKKEPLTPNLVAIDRITKEIAEADVSKLAIVHGGGSFGHPLAKQYSIKEGYKGGKRQLLGFAKTHTAMLTLNKLVLDALIEHNIPAVSISPSSFVITKSGRMTTEIARTVKSLLQTNFLPVLYGDTVLDDDLCFTILSGDQLVSALAMQLGAERIVIGIDEDGLFTTDPKKDPSAKLIEQCTIAQLRRMKIGISTQTELADVTGGMKGKLDELVSAVEKGVPVLIVNATKPNRLYKALKGQQVTGTLIRET